MATLINCNNNLLSLMPTRINYYLKKKILKMAIMYMDLTFKVYITKKELFLILKKKEPIQIMNGKIVI